MNKERLNVGDAVICWCWADTWYKGVPGIVLEHGLFSTLVLINGKVIDVSPATLEVISESR